MGIKVVGKENLSTHRGTIRPPGAGEDQSIFVSEEKAPDMVDVKVLPAAPDVPRLCVRAVRTGLSFSP